MSSNTYQLVRGHLESTRLNLQHYMFRDALGYSLHPGIGTNRDNLKVADVGTGTGIWLSTLSDALPQSSQLDSFEISDAQFPSKISLPDNVKLYVLDAQSDPPQYLHNVYDIVHLRLFLGVVEHDDPRVLIQHAIKLLKPEGHLQWSEFDTMVQKSIGPTDVSSKTLEEICMAPNRIAPKTWVQKLPSLLEEHSLEVCVVERRRECVWQRQMLMESICNIAALIATSKIELNEGPRERWLAVRERSRKAFEQARNGAYFSQIFQVVVVRKPVDVTKL